MQAQNTIQFSVLVFVGPRQSQREPDNYQHTHNPQEQEPKVQHLVGVAPLSHHCGPDSCS